jgi:hypothetical protein
LRPVPAGKDRFAPGTNITDQQPRLHTHCRKTQPRQLAAARAGFGAQDRRTARALRPGGSRTCSSLSSAAVPLEPSAALTIARGRLLQIVRLRLRRPPGLGVAALTPTRRVRRGGDVTSDAKPEPMSGAERLRHARQRRREGSVGEVGVGLRELYPSAGGRLVRVKGWLRVCARKEVLMSTLISTAWPR